MANHSGTKASARLIKLIKASSSNNVRVRQPEKMEEFSRRHRLLSYPTTVPKNVAHVGGEKSYMLIGSLAKLESALMRWTLDQLVSRYTFIPVVVPNIVHDHIIERCGFPTQSHRSQVYKIAATNGQSILDDVSANKNARRNFNTCVAGTSEFALAALHIGDSIPSNTLPKRYCAMSRCYRAEASSTANEWGLYRVHYFNKVEMFAFTMPTDSSAMHDEFLAIQQDLFSQLNLTFRILDMPEEDLGLSAKKKYDVEAWMSGRQRYGEISSTSNCEDYQSSRLGIKYSKMSQRNDQLVIDTGFVHTVNGTACSSIRTLIALIEQNQMNSDRVEVPDVLKPYIVGPCTLPTPKDLESLAELDLYPEVSN